MAGSFELKRSQGQFMWNLKAPNGKVVLTSERYKTRRAAQDGIASVQKNSGRAAAFERKTTSGGRYRFNLTSPNGQVIGTSQSYSSSSGRSRGIRSVQRNARRARIEDRT